MAKLDAYKAKRGRPTPEPFGGSSRGQAARLRRPAPPGAALHYDFRLERDGVLASWAVPKGVPLEEGQKALAVHVEDHPLDYGAFEGEIPKGSYGAGTVEIWDRGTYDLLEDKPDGGLKVRLHGERFEGVWTLVPAHLDGKEQNWLLIRSRDDWVAAAAEPEPAARYRPMLATLTDRLPAGDGWAYEVKFDGYRALAYVRGGCVHAALARGQRLHAAVRRLSRWRSRRRSVRTMQSSTARSACSTRRAARASRRCSRARADASSTRSTCSRPTASGLSTCRSRRGGRGSPSCCPRPDETVIVSEQFTDGQALFDAVSAQGLEGVVAKRLASRYAEGRRTRDWLKLKVTRQPGVRDRRAIRAAPGARASTFGALVLAVNDGGELRYAGNVGTGFDDREIRRLLALMKPLERTEPPFRELPKMPRVRRGDVVWVEPRLVAEVAFSEWTHDGHVRQPSYKGLREDKPPAEVRHERPSADVIRVGAARASPVEPRQALLARRGDHARAISSTTTGRSRLFSSRTCEGRPFTMRRYPDGAFGKAFFQKDAPSHMPEWIKRYRSTVTPRSGGEREIEFPVVDDELALLWMVNMGCIDMNPWYSRIDRPDRPDFVLFDLDPTPEVPWTQTVEVALLVKGLLDGLGLAAFPKTSGGKGIHILVPLDRRSTYDDTRTLRRAHRRHDRRRLPEARDDRLGEIEAPRRPDRREPERDGQDDRLGLFGQAASRRSGLDAASPGKR